MTHFAPSVSEALRDKLEAISDEVRTTIITCLGEGYGCDRIEPISGVPYSGFIPFQHGGFEVSEFIRFDADPSYHICDEMSREWESQYKYFLECMTEECDFDPNDWDKMTDAQQEEIQDAESEWFEPALLRFEIWIKDKNCAWVSKDEGEGIVLRLSLNLTDAPYYRSKSDSTLYEETLSAETVLVQSAADIVSQFSDKVDKALAA